MPFVFFLQADGQIMNIPDWLQQVLSDYDLRTKPHDETEISEAIRNARKAQGGLTNDEEWKAFISEFSAFYFIERPNEDSVWNTYFAPMGTLTRADGSQELRPDIKDLAPDVIEHWKSRALSTKNPLMAARYADLAWDFAKAIANKKSDYKDAQLAIDRYMEAVKAHLYPTDIQAVTWLRRAFSLSVKLKDLQRSKTVIDAIFAFYDEVVTPQKTGIWIFPFDCLYEKADLLESGQASRITTDLETMLKVLSDESNPKVFDPFGAEAAADRLAQHYKRANDKPNVERVIKTYGNAFESLAKSADAMFAQAWLQPVIERYEQEGLKNEAERLQILSTEKGKHIADSMKEVTSSVELDREAIDKTLNQLVGNDSLELSLGRIATYYIPNVAGARAQLKKMSQIAPFMSIVPVTKFDEDGRPIAKIGALDEDPDGRLYSQLAQTISFYAPFLTETIDRMRTTYTPTPEHIVSWLYESPLFLENRRNMLLEGLRAYEQRDFLKAIHLLVPQIEQTLRNFLVLLGISHIKTVRGYPGISDVKGMNQVLEDERVQQAMTENLWRYLTVVFVDRRGLNIRNNLAHGLIGLDNFTRYMADRVFHAVLVLGLMRSSESHEKKQK